MIAAVATAIQIVNDSFIAVQKEIIKTANIPILVNSNVLFVNLLI